MNAKKVKMLITALCAVLIMLGMTASGWAYDPTPYYVSGPLYLLSPTDTILAYDKVSPSSEENELGFLNYVLDDVDLTTIPHDFLYRIDNPEGGNATQLLNYDPGFSWELALVKVDGKNDYLYLFWDNERQVDGVVGDDLLNTPTAGMSPYNRTSQYAISHVSFYGTKQVPEPSTLFLLGAGILGVGLLRMRFKK